MALMTRDERDTILAEEREYQSERAALPPERRTQRSAAQLLRLQTALNWREPSAEEQAAESVAAAAAKTWQEALADAQRRVEGYKAEAARHPAVCEIRARAARLAETIAATQAEGEGAQTALEAVGPAIVAAMTAGGDYATFEKKRDKLTADLARLETRHGELTEARRRVTNELADAERDAFRLLCGSHLPAAKADRDAAEAEKAAMVERHTAEVKAMDARRHVAVANYVELWEGRHGHVMTAGDRDDATPPPADPRFAPAAA